MIAVPSIHIAAAKSLFRPDIAVSAEDVGFKKGYGAFTVSYSQVEVVQNYIQQQESHHKKVTFEDEYRAMLIRHNIQFDPRYLFEAEHHG